MNKYFDMVKRTMKLNLQADKTCFWRRFASDFLNWSFVFYDIIQIKLIVNGVAGGYDMRQTLILALTLNVVMFLWCEIRNLILRREQSRNAIWQQNLTQILADKAASLDYEYIENTDIQNKYTVAQENINGQNGIVSIVNNVIQGLMGVMHVIVGAALILPQLLTPSGETGFKGFVCSPWGFAVLVAVVGGLHFLENFVFGERNNKCYEKVRLDKKVIRNNRIWGVYSNLAFNHYQSGKEIRLYGEQGLILGEMERVTEENRLAWLEAMKASLPFCAGSKAMDMAATGVIYAYAIMRAIWGGLAPGDVIAFVLLFDTISGGITRISDTISFIRISYQNCMDVFAFLDIQGKQYKGTIPTEKRNDNEYEFEFRHVWFKYPNTEQYVLRDVNMKWRIGEKMALVGRNGCGKSTLVKLLCRLYDPTKGEITLNGIDIRKYDYDDYMALFSVVFQDSSLFAFSLAENVAASTEYDAEKVEDCVRRSGLHERLDTLPEGISTYLYKEFDEHGVEISGGEAQKLCLARAIYKGAPFIVLDEPTAALDPISEHDIYTKFNGIVGTRTAIYISHRLSSCRFCDEITVMDNGEIVERGSHDMLVTAGGHYAQLWSAQAEYYRDTAGELFE
ncbi:ABC transporter ATP-binding protein [Ruminococcus sp.]|uniref:ABC transporter ATP-binding protein n=1 Tax=Ruminococcus sp. TaxID=41978 RepID=UPI001B02244B|nr:ABC transporter ATP-binding protein [Ruminococcus sp.]MBO5558593.1 ABC transporter ATP-binding protein [Ruminococcus sp.]